jgi:hypothetical protein
VKQHPNPKLPPSKVKKAHRAAVSRNHPSPDHYHITPLPPNHHLTIHHKPGPPHSLSQRPKLHPLRPTPLTHLATPRD